MTLASPVPPVPGLWSALGKLLRLRWVILVSGIRRAPLRRKIGWSFLGLLGLAFAGFMLFLSWGLLKILSSPELGEVVGDVQSFLDTIPAALMAVVFLSTLLTSFGVLLQALYLAGDMDFLLSAPLPVRAVFLSKLLQAILPNFSLVSLFTLPVLWGLGIASGYNLLYFILGPLLLAALALAAAGIASLLVMAIVRAVPARRVAEVLGFVGAVFTFFCSQTGNLMRFNEFGAAQAQQALQLWERFNQPWSPLVWAGQGLAAVGRLDWLPGLGFTLLTFVACGLVFGFALTLSERLYYSGWASLQAAPRKKSRRSNRHSPAPSPAGSAPAGDFSTALAAPVPTAPVPTAPVPTAPVPTAPVPTIWRSLSTRLLSPAVRAVMIKDFIVLRRDLSNMSQLVTPLIFGLVYVFVFLRGFPGEEIPEDLPPLAAEFMKNLSLYTNVGLSLFVSWMLSTRLAGTAFSMEGKQYWILKQSPLSAGSLMLAKFLVALLPSVALSWIFLIGISLFQRASLPVVVFSMLALAISITGNVGLNLGLGVVGANFEWDDPRQMMKSKGGMGCLVLILNFIQLPLTLLLCFGPSLLFAIFGWPQTLGQLSGLLLGGIFNLLWAGIPLQIGYRRFDRMGE